MGHVLNNSKEYTPHRYQEHMIQHILDKPYSGIFLGMGMGKSSITMTAILELMYNRFDIGKVLIVGPKKVVTDTWTGEAAKWSHLNCLMEDMVIIEGTAAQRKKLLKSKGSIFLINRENVPWLVGTLGKTWDFDTLVIDELSSFKNGASQRFKALRRVRPLIKRVIGLTGTPAPNGVHDLWSQIYLLDQGERLGRTQTEFRERFMTAAPNYAAGHGIMKFTAQQTAEKRIQELIGDICISMKAEDWLDVPERMDQTVVVKLSKEARAKYDQLERDMILPFVGVDVVANGAAVLSNKLLQLANGAVYDEDKGVQLIHDGKLEALQDLVEAANGSPMLVFYTYKHDLERIMKAIPEARKLVSSQDIADWNVGKVPVMLAHPASAGHGLNLQDGGNQVVWFSAQWSLELYEQANARLHRQGQKQKVIVHHLVAEDTMDEEVMKRLASKAAGQEALLLAVKARIARYAE